jgi:hypothetical protein
MRENKRHTAVRLISLIMAGILMFSHAADTMAIGRLVFTNDVFKNDADTFQIGADKNASTDTLTLEFGGTNTKTLSWDTSKFSIGADTSINGGITATGVVDLSDATRFVKPQGSSNPATCIVGDSFFNTTDSLNYACRSTNVWTRYGSGADAGTFDGLDSTEFLRSNTADNFTSGTLTLDNGTTLTVNGTANIGDNGDAVAVDSNTWDVSTAGVASGFTGLTSTGTVNLSGTTSFRIREVAAIASATCTTINELALDTTANQIYKCTVTGNPGTWVSTGGGTAPDFEGVYTQDSDKILTTSNGAFTIAAGSGAVAVNSTNAAGITLNGSVNGPVNIGTGTSTGAVSIGGGSGTAAVNTTSWDISSAGVASGFTGLSSSGTVSFTGGMGASGGTVNLNDSSNNATNINTGTSTGAVTIGGGSGTVAVNSTSWDISTTGLASGFTGITSTGNITFTGATSFRPPQATSAPGTCNVGQIYYNTTTNDFWGCNTTNTWTKLGSGNNVDFENVYSGDSDNTLTTSNGAFTIAGGSGAVSINSSGTGIVSIGNSTGKVGIGTGSPQHMLDVNGSLYSRRYAVTDPGTGTIAIDWDNGNTQSVTITGTGRTVTFSNGQDGGKYVLIIKQDGTGSRTITTWPAAVRWPTGGAVTLTTTASKSDYLGFIYNGVDSKYDAVAFMTNM